MVEQFKKIIIMQILVFNEKEKIVKLHSGPYVLDTNIIAIIRDVTNIAMDGKTYRVRTEKNITKLQTSIKKTTIIYK